MAVLLWLLTKYSQDTIATVQVDINYVNIPNEFILSNRSPKHIEVKILANGFKLFTYALKDAKLTIDLERFLATDNTMIKLEEQEVIGLIKNQWENANIDNITAESMLVFLDRSISKRIPVILDATILFKEGYRTINGVKITPDSIVVNGPSEVIKNIDSVFTKHISLKNLDASFVQEIALVKPDFPNIYYKPDAIRFEVDAEEFSQKSLILPVALINVPEGLNVKIIPESITINFEVSINDFNKVNASNFRVVCDFSEKITDGNFMIPKIVFHPDGIYKIEMTTKKVEYLIFK